MHCAAGTLLFLSKLVSQSDSKREGMQASTYSSRKQCMCVYIYIYCSFYRKISKTHRLPSSILASANRKHKVHCQSRA